MKQKKRSFKPNEKRISTGIYVRTWKSGKKTIRIEFSYRQTLCRETLKLAPTANNGKQAIKLRKKIVESIAFGKFHYSEFFPCSKMAMHLGDVPKHVFIRDLLDAYMIHSKNNHEYSTYSRYQRVCNVHLYQKFGNMPIQELNAYTVWNWLKSLVCQKKTIINILTPLRAIVADALICGYIEKNIFDLINISRLDKKVTSSYVVDPLNKNEIQQLLSVAEEQIKNLFQFAFYTGLRTSELIGLNWTDIDLDQGTIHIKRAVVSGKEKSTKTKSSVRDVLLLPSALNALKAQKTYTYLFRHRVFHNPSRNQPWKSSEQMRKLAWIPLFEKTKLRYRNLYQTRHTYASMMVSGGENFMWVSKQMGHETTQTTSRFYARWIPNPNVLGGYQPINQW